MNARLLGRVLLASAALWLLAGRARAYPQWQFTSGATRCSQCHFAPGGGGLINGYGRDAVADDLSTFAGEGAFLHGQVQLPSRLQLGGDLRGAFLAKDVNDPDGAKRALFPMQADLLARFAFSESLSIYASGGLRGRSRRPGDVIPDTNFQPIHASRLISREHYLMWRPGAQGPYVRAGRFYAPYGLRLAEHVTYVRRDLGFNLLEESYNLSGGYSVPAWEAHLTLFAPDFVRHIGSEEGGLAAYYERRLLGDTAALGLQGRYADGRGMKRFIGGAVGKLHIERLRSLLLAEVNVVEVVLDLGGERSQFVGAGGVAVLPVPGLMATLLYERSQDDLGVRGAVYNAATALLGWFPYPHFELQLMGRLQFPAGSPMAPSLLAQLHYFL